MLKVLVTGGAGFVGSHACKALAQAGHEPIVYDNLIRGNRDSVKWGPLVVGSLGDGDCLSHAFKTHHPDCVMHFAALAYVGESMCDPALYYRNNVAGTIALLDAMSHHDVERIVLSSTCATYGIPKVIPIPDYEDQDPVSPYGASKLMVERILRDYHSAYDLSSVSLRYFNAAGADPEGEIGERHEPETHAIPLAIMAALGRIPTFRIFGTDYPTADGSAVRDYIHVSDLARAHVAALEFVRKEGGATAFNLGTGRGTSVIELVEAVERVSRRKVPIVRQPRRAGDPPILVAEAKVAWEKLGWEPEFLSIDEIVRSAYQWFVENP
jgi:UDP-arabinose 4-epimerase